MRPVVTDTNIVFSALLKDASSFAEIILADERRFVINELVLTELFRNKEKIVRLSGLEDQEVVRLYYDLIRALDVYKEDLLSPKVRKKAYRLCQDIDETDAPHVAITLDIDGVLWTGDERLRAGLESKGFDRFFDPSISGGEAN